MPRDPSSPHPDDEQAHDELAHHIDDFDDVHEDRSTVSEDDEPDGESFDDDELDDLFDYEDLEDEKGFGDKGEGPDA